MEYYGNNDWRDYHLAHHGVKGQKWGVRRYQAYGDGGYDRKGGKTGKLAGEAKQNSASKEDRRKAKDARKLEKIKTKTIKKINKMYDADQKWTTKKIEKLEKKGKVNKANVLKYSNKINEAARKEKIANIKKMKTLQDYKNAKRQELVDEFGRHNMYGKANNASMLTFGARYNEYNRQRNARWAINRTLDKTLGRMSPEEGYEYLRRKAMINESGHATHWGRRSAGRQYDDNDFRDYRN